MRADDPEGPHETYECFRGATLKCAVYAWLREREPSATKILTWNADSNAAIRAVNDRLGFAEMDSGRERQLRL